MQICPTKAKTADYSSNKPAAVYKCLNPITK